MGRQEVFGLLSLWCRETEAQEKCAGLGLVAGVRLLLTPLSPVGVPVSRIGCPLPVTRFQENPCFGQQYLANASLEFVAGHLSSFSRGAL